MTSYCSHPNIELTLSVSPCEPLSRCRQVQVWSDLIIKHSSPSPRPAPPLAHVQLITVFDPRMSPSWDWVFKYPNQIRSRHNRWVATTYCTQLRFERHSCVHKFGMSKANRSLCQPSFYKTATMLPCTNPLPPHLFLYVLMEVSQIWFVFDKFSHWWDFLQEKASAGGDTQCSIDPVSNIWWCHIRSENPKGQIKCAEYSHVLQQRLTPCLSSFALYSEPPMLLAGCLCQTWSGESAKKNRIFMLCSGGDLWP